MGQVDVYEYLQTQRTIKPEGFFSVRQICAGLKAEGCAGSTLVGGVGLACAKLEADGFLEVIYPGKNNHWRRLFRLHRKHWRRAK